MGLTEDMERGQQYCNIIKETLPKVDLKAYYDFDKAVGAIIKHNMMLFLAPELVQINERSVKGPCDTEYVAVELLRILDITNTDIHVNVCYYNKDPRSYYAEYPTTIDLPISIVTDQVAFDKAVAENIAAWNEKEAKRIAEWKKKKEEEDKEYQLYLELDKKYGERKSKGGR